ncbi:MAG: twin-arginine translocase subunit TatC [Chloroflexi bacterium]|nr:MAG: twin-arginine translocase subunit TatC [Chloroflexota bacterium]TMF45036.1 MAG: twin-arginine translocase subunit TatC [Chloroflexota bacterium]
MATIDQQDPMATVDEYSTDEEEELDESAMSLVDHLEELRWRIFKSIIAVVVGAIAAFFFRVQIMTFLTWPLPKTADQIGKGKLIVTGLAEGFTVFLKLSLAAGILIAIPVILYQIWAFVAPGLYDKEKKTAVPFIFVGIVLFLVGISLGYIVLQYPVQWLVNFASDSFTELVSADSYFTFVAFFLLAFGIVFEIPLVLTFLAQLGLVTSQTLRRKRPTAHIGMWIAATFLTPGADFYSPIILGVAMSFLYELTIVFIRITKH